MSEGRTERTVSYPPVGDQVYALPKFAVGVKNIGQGAGLSGITLSPEQQAVVDHRGGDLQVIACAGSGKTESISRRIAALIADGAEPESIVAFTFTERAAAELKERVVERVAERMGAAFRDRLGPMYVGTIHGYCFRILQDHVPRYGNFDLLDPNRHAGLLSREYRTLKLSRLGARHWQPIRDFAQTVDVMGNEMISVDDLGDIPLADCVRDHRALLERYRLMTFSMMVQAAVEVLDDLEIFERVHGRLRHLVVDEYQDINPAQEALIEKLATGDVELCVVGDDDQSIYQWRGSDVSNIVEFTHRREGATAITLDANRRSHAPIVRAASAFARSIPGRLDKEMVPVRPDGDRPIIPWKADTAEAEATLIADAIARMRAQGRPYRDIAVLYRSVRGSAPPLLDALDARGIPYSCSASRSSAEGSGG